MPGIKIFQLNCQSARNKYASLNSLFSELHFRFDIIMLTETWYTNDDNPFSMPGYNVFCVNRTHSRGGGVCLLVKETFDCQLLTEFCYSEPDCEMLTAVLSNYVISVMYRPPSGSITTFTARLESLFHHAMLNNHVTVCGGDINIDMLSNGTSQHEMTCLFDSFGLANMINMPTRVTACSSTLIDVFLTSISSEDTKAGTISCDISDHLPIFLAIRQRIKKKRLSIPVRSITSKNLENFRQELINTSWNDVLANDNPNIAVNTFIEKFKEVYDHNFPRITHRPSKKIRKPWITRDLLHQINEKNVMYNAFLVSRDPQLLSTFKKFRNRLNKDIQKARQNYFHNIFMQSAGNSASTWKNINKVLGTPTSNSVITEITINGCVINGSNLSNTFNDYLVNLAFPETSLDATSYVSNKCSSTMFVRPTCESEVYKTIMRLRNSNCCDCFDFQIKPIKHTAEIIAQPFSEIINLCLGKGIFPAILQTAKVCILYKKGDKNNLANYRPISILPVFSKIIEKILHSQLAEFINKHNMLCDAQYGFRKYRSTELALLDQKEFILNSIECKQLVLGVFIDFSKAFDSLNRLLLLRKLDLYGVRGVALDLLDSYLSERKQYVCINNFSSVTKPNSLGVPQGSILGPFLFNLYINDIVNIDPSAKFVIYADDTSVFFAHNDTDQLIQKGNNILEKIYKWACSNGLLINAEKTKAVIFRAKGKQVQVSSPLYLNNSLIEIVDNVKTLGIVFSNNMLWDAQVEQVATKTARVLGIIYRNNYLLPLKTILIIYHSLFMSYVNYCFIVWGDTTQTNIEKLTRLQTRFLKIIAKKEPYQSVMYMQQKYKLISFQNLYSYNICRTIKKELKQKTVLSDLANLQPSENKYDTRKHNLWLIPRSRTKYGDQMVRSVIPRMLNYLSSNDVNIETMTTKNIASLFL